MIYYLHFIGDFWLTSVVKVFDWFSEALFLDNRRRRRGRSRATMASKRHVEEDELELGLGSVSFTRGIGRKRILFSTRSAVDIPATIQANIPAKSQRNRAAIVSPPPFSRLELLPQELLVRVICGVDHEDLNSLSIVSKTIREASLEAKRLHFAYSTPKKSQAFRNSIVLENVSGSNHLVEDDLEPPNAPVRHRWTGAKRKEQLANVTVALFT
ncbi:unnamed protein product [Cochlearia groenlandica]